MQHQSPLKHILSEYSDGTLKTKQKQTNSKTTGKTTTTTTCTSSYACMNVGRLAPMSISPSRKSITPKVKLISPQTVQGLIDFNLGAKPKMHVKRNHSSVHHVR